MADRKQKGLKPCGALMELAGSAERKAKIKQDWGNLTDDARFWLNAWASLEPADRDLTYRQIIESQA